MNDENVISIYGKNIDCSKLSDEQLIKLYNDLKQREAKLYNRIVDFKEKYGFIPDVDINKVN